MAENNIELKSISELLRMNFFIPSYQRGYRWNEQQIKDLLTDIDNFTSKEVPNSQETTWYCLQPIVVKAKDNQWEVIDGQQRLTTIYLILHYFNQGYVENRRKKLFELEYDTRQNSKEFLQNINKKTENEAKKNIDYHHIFNAYKTIIDWFNKKGQQYNQNDFESKFIFKTQVIWYETDGDGRDVFTRINMGKIPLTNAELIKAIFLNSSNFEKNNTNNKERVRLKQLEIANEWDFIEYSLHKEEFWLFINKEENEKETRIEYLFELLIGFPKVKNKNNKEFKTFEEYYKETGDYYYTYKEFDKKFKEKSEKEIEENWKQVKRYFQTLQDWFDNRELYHKIGFLITIGENIKNLIVDKFNKNSTDFLQHIDVKIKDTFINIQLSKIEYGNRLIRPLLLLHNIQTMLNNKNENSCFPFYRFKTEKWDIEHIHAKASIAKVKDEFEEQQNWLIENFEKDDSVHKTIEYNKRIDDIVTSKSGTTDNKFQEIVEYVLGEEDNSLRNLCLLDKGTNRSYKNDAFKSKRKKIIAQEREGTFIPICTRNIFMKYYSTELKQLGQWSELDRNAYYENIKEILMQYLPTQKED